MAKRVEDQSYFVKVIRSETATREWRWEVHRAPEPLGVRISVDGYGSAEAAEREGKVALRALLRQIAAERRPRQ